ALGPAGRLALVKAIESGMTLRAAAAALNVAPATAHRWWHRWRSASEAQRHSGSWLADRPCTPRRQPRRLSAAEEEPILRARRQTGLGPGRLAGICRRARSTIWKVLNRHGLSKHPRGERQTYRRYEWSRPGALLHMDVKRLARFEQPGHAATGEKHDRNRGVGWEFLHVVIDDHSRLAYVERHPREDAETNAATLERAIAWFASLGLDPPEAVMTDNAMVYRQARLFRDLLRRHGARHILTPPYTPRWNGKAERFIQTLQREWAYAHRWQSSTERLRSLSSFLRYYNRHRPHSSLGDRPPISRVLNVCGQDT
ncbi:MAG TPA: IS481 family transposase, partial [Solirubrobacterales bacterium]|nr:IS481 family transposase [Solirubrobacterales bacterium]